MDADEVSPSAVISSEAEGTVSGPFMITITFSEVDSNSAILLLSWDKVHVPIQLEVDLEETVMPQIDSMLKAEDPKPYFHIAMFLFVSFP